MTLDEHFIDKKVRTTSSSWETPPPSGGWSRIERSLQAQRSARIVLMRRRLTSVAAVLLAFFTGYLIADYSGHDVPSNNPQQIEQRSLAETTTETPGKDPESTFQLAEAPTTGMSHGNSDVMSQPTKRAGTSSMNQTDYSSATSSSPIDVLPDILLTQLTVSETESELMIPEPVIPPMFHRISRLSDAIHRTEMHKMPIPKTPSDPRWSIAGVAGQTVANYYQGQSPTTDQVMYRHDIVASSRDRVVNPLSSLGAEVRYQVSSRWGLSSGITMHQFATTISDIQQPEIATLSTNQPVGNALGQVSFNQKIRNDLVKKPVIEVDANRFEQHLSYVEIPLMASWRIAERRIGFGVNAGFGTNLLIDNAVTLVEESGTRPVGHTEGIRDVFVSSIVSLDLILNLHPKWSWSFTPLYRHALQPVSNSDFDPRIISFGLYTGLNYKF